jgi:UDP-2,3-diacylglucosamine pyrophosphatase LpxH
MGDRTKRIFISDIHLGDARSMSEPHPYGWFRQNVFLLTRFLEEQLTAPDVKEVVILGDLFDDWVIPVNASPLTAFDSICSNVANKPVVDMLRALAASPDVKLAYVPGNHDMGMNAAGISAAKEFMEATFPGIRYFCDNSIPLGVYNVGPLVAEHGNRYCVFNAPDTWTGTDTFLPLGYFISRMVAYKVKEAGHDKDPHDIFIDYLRRYSSRDTHFVDDLFYIIAAYAGLTPSDPIDLEGIPGYPAKLTVGEIGKRFRNLFQDWDEVPGHINLASAIVGDIKNLWYAACTHFCIGSHIKIVIFGHTHAPTMGCLYERGHLSENVTVSPRTPCRAIYANCGTWVDKAKQGCTYVETEEVANKRRYYVRVRKYPSKKLYQAMEGFVET